MALFIKQKTSKNSKAESEKLSPALKPPLDLKMFSISQELLIRCIV